MTVLSFAHCFRLHFHSHSGAMMICAVLFEGVVVLRVCIHCYLRVIVHIMDGPSHDRL